MSKTSTSARDKAAKQLAAAVQAERDAAVLLDMPALLEAMTGRGEIAKQWGENLKAARLAAGMTQREIGLRSGCSNPTIARLESGEFGGSHELRTAIAHVLDMNVSDIWTDLTPEQLKKYLVG